MSGGVSDPDYKAFISYSHADEAWARWLHRALEGYRVPRRLIGRETVSYTHLTLPTIYSV